MKINSVLSFVGAGLLLHANAGIVLLVDVSIPSAVTITASGSFSQNTASGSSLDGVDLLSFFSSAIDPTSPATLSGSLTPSGASSAFNGWMSDNLSAGGGINPSRDVNLYGDADTISFTTSSAAFSGVATLDLSALSVSLPSAGASGNVLNGYSGAGGHEVIGQWSVVPEPQTYAMLAGLGLVGFATVRRMVKK